MVFLSPENKTEFLDVETQRNLKKEKQERNRSYRA